MEKKRTNMNQNQHIYKHRMVKMTKNTTIVSFQAIHFVVERKIEEKKNGQCSVCVCTFFYVVVCKLYIISN